MQRLPQPRWMRTVQAGDVIRRPNGPFRVVREVSRYPDGRLRSVWLVIRRCSWTHRCYTILGYTDLRILGYRRVRVKRRALRRCIDKKIQAALHERGWENSLRCCDVEGVA